MTIGLFAPLPLAMMIPFMAGQSLMMGEAFGKGFQYGKRKISAMSNEEFNKLTPGDLGQGIQTDYAAIIPHLGQAVKQSSDFQSLVIKEIIDVIKNLPADIIGGFTGTSNPETTSTAASVYGVSGTTQVRYGPGYRGGQATVTNDIERAARAYMEATGLADFERAKQIIKQRIVDAKKPVKSPFVRKEIPVQPHTFQKLVSGLSLVEINSNIANYRAAVSKLTRRVTQLRNPPKAPASQIILAQLQLRKQQSLLADWIKKGQNYQVLLRNR